MKFQVTRTSLWRSDKQPPIEGLIRERVVKTLRLTLPTLEIARVKQPWFFEKGFNHRVEGGFVAHDYHEEVWTVELLSLEELIAFSKKAGDSLVMETYDGLPLLEIYDNYRE